MSENRLHDKTVLITGATAGIGEACARAFAARGARLVLVGRRRDRLEALKQQLSGEAGVEVRVASLDVSDRDAIASLRDELERSDWQPDILINNAGKALGLDVVHEGSIEDWDEMIDTNVKGLLYLTRAFLPAMVERNRGHVVNIGSTAGRWLYPKGNVYAATKFAVRGLTEGLNMDLVGTRVRVSSVDPGLVETEFSKVRFHGDEARAGQVYRGYTPLRPADVADAVIYVCKAPEHVDVFNIVLMPTDQRHSMVVHREEG